MGLWNSKTIHFVKIAAKLSQDSYPEIMGKMFICNAPMLFTGIYSLAKGWVDEKTRKKITLCGSNYYKKLLEYVDEDQIPEFLGGKNKATCSDDVGPWKEYVVVNGKDNNGVVGIRRIDDPTAEIFTPQKMLELENPII